MSRRPARTVLVRCMPSGRERSVPVGTRLFDAVRATGLPLASSCGGDGTCGRCGLRLLTGRLSAESALEARVKADNRLAEDLRLSCLCSVLLPQDPDDEPVVTVQATYW